MIACRPIEVTPFLGSGLDAESVKLRIWDGWGWRRGNSPYVIGMMAAIHLRAAGNGSAGWPGAGMGEIAHPGHAWIGCRMRTCTDAGRMGNGHDDAEATGTHNLQFHNIRSGQRGAGSWVAWPRSRHRRSGRTGKGDSS